MSRPLAYWTHMFRQFERVAIAMTDPLRRPHGQLGGPTDSSFLHHLI